MKEALWPLSMKVVSAKAASPSGAGSATGASSTSVGRLLGEQRRETVLLEDVTGEAVQVLAGNPGLDGRNRAVERLAAEPVVLAQLVGRLADHEGAGHVRVAAGLAVAREEVEADRLVRRDRAGAHVVADRRLGAVRDDELVREDPVLGEDLLDRELQALARERLAFDDEAAVLPPGRAQQLPGRVHRAFRGSLGPADTGQLRFALDAPAADEQLAVGLDVDAVGA